jgi:hypothetical protein
MIDRREFIRLLGLAVCGSLLPKGYTPPQEIYRDKTLIVDGEDVITTPMEETVIIGREDLIEIPLEDLIWGDWSVTQSSHDGVWISGPADKLPPVMVEYILLAAEDNP